MSKKYHKCFWFNNPPDISVSIAGDTEKSLLIPHLRRLELAVSSDENYQSYDKIMSKHFNAHVFYVTESEKKGIARRLKRDFHIPVDYDVCTMEICLDGANTFIFAESNADENDDIYDRYAGAQCIYSERHHLSGGRIICRFIDQSIYFSTDETESLRFSREFKVALYKFRRELERA